MRRVNEEGGAAAVMVIIMVLVLIGFAAMVIDVGAMHAEARQLQNVADAGSMAIAQECAAGSCGDMTGTANFFATANSNDALSTATPAYPGENGANSITVTATTLETGGKSTLTWILAQALGQSEITLQRKATASWGAPLGLTSQLPITISKCEWDAYTAGGFEPAGPYPSPTPWPTEKVIYFHNTSGLSPCPAGPSGADLAGGFGWLDTTEDCVATTDAENWVDDSTGAPAPNDCSKAELMAMLGKPIHIPIFDQTNGLTGANGEYHIVGYAAFVLTGYKFPGDRVKSLISNQFPCGGDENCISGFFTEDMAPSAGGPIGGPSMGVTVVGLTG
jgi:hypothetical protein